MTTTTRFFTKPSQDPLWPEEEIRVTQFSGPSILMDPIAGEIGRDKHGALFKFKDGAWTSITVDELFEP